MSRDVDYCVEGCMKIIRPMESTLIRITPLSFVAKLFVVYTETYKITYHLFFCVGVGGGVNSNLYWCI